MLNFNYLASRINLSNCRRSPRNNFIRCNWIPFITVILISLVTEVLFAQTMILKPPSVQDSDGDYEIKLLLKQDAEFRLEWTNLDASVLNLTGSNAKLIIGRASNTYQTLEIDVDGNQAD